MAELNYLYVVIPQGNVDNPKMEFLFEQLLVNLHNMIKDEQISLEMFGLNQYTYFFIVIPVELTETIQGLIYSAFQDAEISQNKDFTLTFDKSKQQVSGCSLNLKFQDIYSFKTYDQFAEDSQSGLFTVISKLDGAEQIWVQVLITPKNESGGYHFERSVSVKVANLKQSFSVKDRLRMKGNQSFTEKRAENSQAKYEKEPFLTSIKLAYVAKDSKTAKLKLNAVINSFYRFGITDIQEFGVVATSEGENFIKKFQKRQHEYSFLLGVNEVATLFHFPNSDYVPHISHVLAKKAEPPKDLPKKNDGDVSLFGVTNYHNNLIEFGIRREDRRRHLYVVGKSGSGKSKLLELLVKSDIDKGHGVGVLDPHGDLVDNIMAMVPEHRIKDVILFDPSDVNYPIAFNPLENVDEAFKMQITIGFIYIFKKLFGSNWSDRLEHVLRYTTLALLDSPNTTILSILKMLTDKNYRQRIVARINDSIVKNFWVSEFASWSEKFDAEAITPLLNKVGQLVATNMIRNIIGQSDNKFSIKEVMDGKKILLMKVSKGLLGEENSALLGAMIITKIYQSAMQRANIAEDKREDFYFYVDEFQNFATESFAEILSEARKYRLNLTIAHQYMGQLNDTIQKTVFGNIGSMISFRVGADDARVLAEEYNPIFKERDIINLGVREFYTKMSVAGEIREAFSGKTLSIPKLDFNYTEQIIAHSRATYCRPREEVEEFLKKWDEASSDEVQDEFAADMGEPVFEEPLL